MSRKPVWPPTIQHHKASGRAKVRYRGHDYYLGAWGTPQVQENYARLLVELLKPPRPAAKEAAALTVAEVISEWWTREAPRLSERGRERTRFRRALAPVLRLYGESPAAGFDADALEAVQLAMASGSWMSDAEKAAAAKHGDPVRWAASNVNRAIVRVRTVWRWLERKKLVPAGAWGALRALPGLKGHDARVRHTAPVKPATWQETLAVAKRCSPTVRTMLLLHWWSGMRSQDVRQLRPREVDTSGDVWLYRPPLHKNDWRGQGRMVPLGPKCQALLRPLLSGADPDAYLFRPTRRRDGHQALCYTVHTYPQAVRRAAERAEIKDFHPYRCRHSAKQRITRAAGLDAARAVLGQRSLESTAGYASEVDEQAARAAARRLG